MGLFMVPMKRINIAIFRKKEKENKLFLF